MSVATQHDVEVSLMRDLTPAEAKFVPELLSRAHTRIKRAAPDLFNTAGTPVSNPDLVREVEADAVARVLRADGAIYVSESEGEYSYRLNTAVASAALQVTHEEINRLRGALVSLAPQTDGYLAARTSIDPSRAFQYAWPQDLNGWPL